ncbi:hypothetical protein BURPS1710b_A1341 [Burkholderia pseudomallei 1710b]|uniref:Uncharacterized protein n=1 Tax=Burkholderia pseudomallei (strain 1710b) TaxID=320372 RepID=Q3JIV5_BURP1|nr:hypothetical protein BURPS1710b_A1341 [Burkholderia pseudomallei 1710b]
MGARTAGAREPFATRRGGERAGPGPARSAAAQRVVEQRVGHGQRRIACVGFAALDRSRRVDGLPRERGEAFADACSRGGVEPPVAAQHVRLEHEVQRAARFEQARCGACRDPRHLDRQAAGRIVDVQHRRRRRREAVRQQMLDLDEPLRQIGRQRHRTSASCAGRPARARHRAAPPLCACAIFIVGRRPARA